MVSSKLGLAAAAAFLAVAMPAAASAATLTFNLAGGTSVGNSYGNVRNYSATVDGQTVNMQATAWTAFAKQGGGYTVQKSYLGSWDAGLGVTNTSDSGGAYNYHTIDNKNGYDFVVFRFDQDVDVSSITFTPYSVSGSTDSDAWIGIGQTDVDFGDALSFSNWSGDVSLFDTMYESSGGKYASTRDINPWDETGNLLFIGASMTELTKKGGWDGFKIRALTVDTILPPPPPPAVPEPATWAMMIAGFGLVGGALRRRSGRFAIA